MSQTKEAAVYQLVRSKRKTVSLSVNARLAVVVRAPLRMPQSQIQQFVAKHTEWIEKQRAVQQQLADNPLPTLSGAEVLALRTRARTELPPKVEQFAIQMGVQPTGLTITSAKTRWGSCSGKNRLSFPYRLMLLPEPLIDYIVVHELAHIREKTTVRAFTQWWLPPCRTTASDSRSCVCCKGRCPASFYFSSLICTAIPLSSTPSSTRIRI